MTANGQILAASPADQLRDRLDDPQIAASLNNLLDHADLLSVLVTGLDGFIQRGDTITNSLASAVGELTGSASSFTASVGGSEALKNVDLPALASTLAGLSGALVNAAPALNTLLASRLTDVQSAEVLAQLGDALVEGKEAAAADPGGPRGIFGFMKVAKDKDVARGLGFMIQVAKAFGRRLPQ